MYFLSVQILRYGMALKKEVGSAIKQANLPQTLYFLDDMMQ